MKLKNILILSCALALTSPCASFQTPQDSVVNGRHRGHSKVEISTAPAAGFSYIMKAVPMASWAKDDHVIYGPFTNKSNMTVKILVESIGDKNWSELGAWIDGVKIRTQKDAVEFEVPPNSTYAFSAKDRSTLTVSVYQNKASASEVGLPSEVDFLRPHGRLKKCLQRMYFDEFNIERPAWDPVYIYEAGSMSDGSVCMDNFHEWHRDLARGIGPSSHDIPCEKVYDYLPGSCYQGDVL